MPECHGSGNLQAALQRLQAVVTGYVASTVSVYCEINGVTDHPEIKVPMEALREDRDLFFVYQRLQRYLEENFKIEILKFKKFEWLHEDKDKGIRQYEDGTQWFRRWLRNCVASDPSDPSKTAVFVRATV